MNLLQNIDDIAASQKVRAFDVYLLGPFLLYAASQKTLGTWSRRALFTAGLYTVLYNWKSYRNIRSNLEQSVQNSSLSSL